MSKQKLLEEQVMKAAKDGKITCARLRRIADERGVPYRQAGKAADRLQIKIKHCDLGCF
ncbi:MAG: hypothetical protein AB1499_03730 [Nitrospirota bacterium]